MKESQYKDVKIPEDVTLDAGTKYFFGKILKRCDRFAVRIR